MKVSMTISQLADIVFLFRSPEFLVGTKKRRDVLKADKYIKLLIRMAVYKVHISDTFNVDLF